MLLENKADFVNYIHSVKILSNIKYSLLVFHSAFFFFLQIILNWKDIDVSLFGLSL